ncbi:MAG: hypothetical protein AB7V55_01895, partial [Oscillospiraceae bacterium]
MHLLASFALFCFPGRAFFTLLSHPGARSASAMQNPFKARPLRLGILLDSMRFFVLFEACKRFVPAHIRHWIFGQKDGMIGKLEPRGGGAMRLLTRSDFDGLACAALLKELGIIDTWKFVHPKDLQDGIIEV